MEAPPTNTERMKKSSNKVTANVIATHLFFKTGLRLAIEFDFVNEARKSSIL